MRAKYAQRGLSQGESLDVETRAMLLRQLYLSHMEGRRCAEALAIAEQIVSLGVLEDVARQDAARACLGVGDVVSAVEHLRLASRVAPPSRRAFHLWTLGSVLYLSGRPRESVAPLSRAARWSTTERPLYEAQLALARLACGDDPGDLEPLRERLANAACGQGYGQFVLGELCYHLDKPEASEQYLDRFVQRSTSGRVALVVALRAEIKRARLLLRHLRRRSQRKPDP